MQKGYTLIELLAVVSLVGIVASVSLPALQAIENEAKSIKATAEVKTVQALVERYQKQSGYLPQNLEEVLEDDKINITQRNILDPFAPPNTNYLLKTGQIANGKEYYVIYSLGLNQTCDFYLKGNKIFNQGDDIIASNLTVIK